MDNPEPKGDIMKVLSEEDETVVRMQCEFTEPERQLLLEYSDRNMSQEEREELLIGWSLVEILKEQVNSKMSEGKV